MADAETSKKASANPLPYVIVFAILFLVGLVALTWTLGVYYKANQCAIYPNIWCADNWVCNNTCGGGFTGNACFGLSGSTGLSSCLFGPNSTTAQVCFQVPEAGLSCTCTTGMQQTNNCFSGCAQDFASIAGTTNCCCCPGKPGCPWTTPEEVPSVCGSATNCT